MPFQNLNSLPIRDFVIALGTVDKCGAFQLEGTGFLIGSRGLVVTAGHVADALQRGATAVALFVDGNRWQSVAIINFENHASEDVAIVQLSGSGWKSIYRISRTPEFASQEVMMWGYPERVAQEIRKSSADPFLQQNGVNADLIYMKGYIRRRLSRQMPTGNFIGSAFYEISEAGGSCYSGAPVCPRQPGRTDEVIGIYVGEETAGRRDLGIVVRCEAIADWVPAMCGVPIAEEVPTHT